MFIVTLKKLSIRFQNLIATEITSNVNTTWFCTLLLKTNIISEFQNGRIFNHLFVRVETKRKLHKQYNGAVHKL